MVVTKMFTVFQLHQVRRRPPTVPMGHNEESCDACPIFVTFAFNGKTKRTTSGVRKRAASLNSTEIFLRAIRVAAHSLAHAHRGCWKLYVYCDDKEILGGWFHGMGLGPQVVLRGEKRFAGNVYDGPYRNYTALANEKRGYQSLSRIKLDLVTEHLDRGEKVIWMDLDTLVTSDMSCIYQNLENFVIAPGFNKGASFSPVNHTRRGLKRDRRYMLNGSSFVFGDIWMVDRKLLDAVLRVEATLERQNLTAMFDIQSLFSILHAKRMQGLNDLANMTERWNRSWGYQHVVGNMIPYVRVAKLGAFRVGYDRGKLYSLTTGQSVGVMSWNWPSFVRMMVEPCIFFSSSGAPDWVDKISVWGNSTIDEFKVNGCKNTRKHVYLLLAPHYDDASLSLGGTLSRLSRAPQNLVIVVTVMGGKPDVPIQTTPDRFAGFANSSVAVESRREENRQALFQFGAEIIDLPFLDLVYEKRRVDSIVANITKGIVEIVRSLNSRGFQEIQVIGPMGYLLSRHQDHESVHVATIKAAQQLGPTTGFSFYEDFPYVLGATSTRHADRPDFTLSPVPRYFTEDDFLNRVQQIEAYKSQARYIERSMKHHRDFYMNRCKNLSRDLVRFPFCEMTWRYLPV